MIRSYSYKLFSLLSIIILYFSVYFCFGATFASRKCEVKIINAAFQQLHHQGSVKSGIITFTFSLSTNCTTSAGVYKADGTLIRTLWNAVRLNKGSYTRTWDGMDDLGVLCADGNYNIKILSNNVTYTWEGVIGNTSDSLTGPSVHHAMNKISCMAFAGNTGYFSINFTEQDASTFKLTASHPQQKQVILTKGISTQFVCTDGEKVYWAGTDIKLTDKSFVFATSVADDSEISFASGKTYKAKYGRLYKSAIDTGSIAKSAITGLAVQTKSKFLFVAHSNSNQLTVINKNTGSVVQVVPFTYPQSLCVDQKDNLWVVYKDLHQKKS